MNHHALSRIHRVHRQHIPAGGVGIHVIAQQHRVGERDRAVLDHREQAVVDRGRGGVDHRRRGHRRNLKLFLSRGGQCALALPAPPGQQRRQHRARRHPISTRHIPRREHRRSHLDHRVHHRTHTRISLGRLENLGTRHVNLIGEEPDRRTDLC